MRLFNKGEYKIYETNSSLGVQCDVKEKCELRHTTICDNCKHNHGMKREKCFYEPR